jgi:sec-independent protein translocase protein TatC
MGNVAIYQACTCMRMNRANSRGAVFITSLLFLRWVCFSYFLIAPLTINFLGGYQVSEMVANQVALRSYITTITMVTFATGIVLNCL